MKTSEKEQLRQEILTKNIYMRQLRIWFLLSLMGVIAFALIAFWGFSGMADSFLPSVDAGIRLPIALITAILSALAGVFTLLVLVGLINGRKHVLGLIDRLNGKTK